MECKEQFVQGLGDLLMMYSRERVTRILYERTESGLEFASIFLVSGDVIKQDITGDSCIAIMHDVWKALT